MCLDLHFPSVHFASPGFLMAQLVPDFCSTLLSCSTLDAPSEFWPRHLLSQRRAPDRSKQCSAPTKRCSIWLQEICQPGWTWQLQVVRPTHVNRTLTSSVLLGAKNAIFLFVCAPLEHSQCLERCLVMWEFTNHNEVTTSKAARHR